MRRRETVPEMREAGMSIESARAELYDTYVGCGREDEGFLNGALDTLILEAQAAMPCSKKRAVEIGSHCAAIAWEQPEGEPF